MPKVLNQGGTPGTVRPPVPSPVLVKFSLMGIGLGGPWEEEELSVCNHLLPRRRQ